MTAIVAQPRSGRARSLVKAFSWRALGTLDTFLWGLLITHKPFSAGAIATAEVFTKVGIYYLHERLWQWIAWDPDGRGRAIVKAITWRFVGSLDTFMLSLILTRKLHYAVSIASGEALTKIVLYYLHERVWYRIGWGRKTDGEPAAAVEAEVAEQKA
jgi:uncharacterized membrane protein